MTAVPPRTILYVCSVPFVGGGEISLATLASHLPTDRWRPVFAVPGEGALAALLRGRGFPVQVMDVPSPNVTRDFRPVTTIRRIADAAWKCGAALVHNNSFPYLLPAVAARAITRLPLVCHVRDRIPDAWFDAWRHRAALACVDRIVCISRHVAAPFGERPALRVVYNGVEAERFSGAPATLRRDCQWGDGPLIGMLGYRLPRKGHETLIEAAPAIIAQAPNVRFCFIGDDPFPERGYTQVLQARIAALGLERHFMFTGYRDDVPGTLRDLTLLAMPSWDEPFGRVIIEAFAAGVPVVAAGVGGPLEIIEPEASGLLAPPREPAAWAAAILRLLRDSALRERLIAGGRQAVAATFSAAACAAGTASVYDEVLS